MDLTVNGGGFVGVAGIQKTAKNAIQGVDLLSGRRRRSERT